MIFLVCFLTIIIALTVLFIVRYLDGDFSIKKIEEVRKDTYNMIKYDEFGDSYNSGKQTKIVKKITYISGRERYKTITIRH